MEIKCSKCFRVQVGGETFKSKILDEVIELPSGDWNVRKLEDAQEGARVINVPVEHYLSFVSDLDKAIRDIAGLSTSLLRRE